MILLASPDGLAILLSLICAIRTQQLCAVLSSRRIPRAPTGERSFDLTLGLPPKTLLPHIMERWRSRP